MPVPDSTVDRQSLEARRRIFFYAEDDAALYDSDANLNTPWYSELHDFCLRLAIGSILADSAEHPDRPIAILDIGSGTGAECIPLLERFPGATLVAVDICFPMHTLLRAKLEARFGQEEVQRRVRCVTGDIADFPHIIPRIREALQELSGQAGFSAIVSALTLHHLTSAEKKELYPNLYSLLAAGGSFINADLFGYGSPWLHRTAQEYTLDWIRRQHDPQATAYPEQLKHIGSKAPAIAAKWLDHCEKYNILLPVGPSSVEEDLSVPDLNMLLQAGYRAADCPYRYWQTAVTWARK